MKKSAIAQKISSLSNDDVVALATAAMDYILNSGKETIQKKRQDYFASTGKLLIENDNKSVNPAIAYFAEKGLQFETRKGTPDCFITRSSGLTVEDLDLIESHGIIEALIKPDLATARERLLAAPITAKVSGFKL